MTDHQRLAAVLAVVVLLTVALVVLGDNGWQEESSANRVLPLSFLLAGWLLGRSWPTRAHKTQEPTS